MAEFFHGVDRSVVIGSVLALGLFALSGLDNRPATVEPVRDPEEFATFKEATGTFNVMAGRMLNRANKGPERGLVISLGPAGDLGDGPFGRRVNLSGKGILAAAAFDHIDPMTPLDELDPDDATAITISVYPGNDYSKETQTSYFGMRKLPDNSFEFAVLSMVKPDLYGTTQAAKVGPDSTTDVTWERLTDADLQAAVVSVQNTIDTLSGKTVTPTTG